MNRGFKTKKKFTIKRESEKRNKKKQQQHQEQEYSSWITSFLKRFSIEFQEVEKNNFQIKENMEE